MKISQKPIICVALYISCIALLLCAGCSRPYGELFTTSETPLVWPEPPDKPRIRFVGTLSTEKDLKKEVLWTESLTEFIFGKKDIGVLLNPYAVVKDKENRLFIADTSGGVIHIFDLKTREYKPFSSISKNKSLIMPIAITLVDKNIYVVDSVLHEVCFFDRKGKFRGSFGSDQLIRPSGIAYHSERDKLYVSDTGGHAIKVFDKSGEFIETIGSRGIGPGQFNFPTHIWVDSLGQLYVSDTLNYRVQIFSGEGAFLKMFGEHGDRPGSMAHPSGVATDSFGHIYVVDRQFENVQIFDKAGLLLMAFGDEGTDIGEFWLPGGLYIDNRNRIYVADPFNKRIQVFELIDGEEK
jgi:DNA-binding beta-propeller fold protein YncE